MQCTQCPKPAFYNYGGANLCLDCLSKLKQIEKQDFIERAIMMNYLSDSMDETSGIPSYSRIQIPQTMLHQDKSIRNFIQIDKSIVGSVNTGVIGNLNQTMENIANNINEDLANQLSEFIKQAIESNEIEENKKEELLEKLAFLSEQIVTSPEKRKPSLIKNVISSVKDIVTSAVALEQLWQKIEPIITTLF